MSKISRKGAEEARNQLPSLLEDAEQGGTTIITHRGRPVAVLGPFKTRGIREQQPLKPMYGSGRGLWGPQPRGVRKLRDEWER